MEGSSVMSDVMTTSGAARHQSCNDYECLSAIPVDATAVPAEIVLNVRSDTSPEQENAAHGEFLRN